MHTKGLQDPWGPRKNANDSTKISDTFEIAIDLGFIRIYRRLVRNHSKHSKRSDESMLKPIEKPKGFWKERFQSWKKTFQRVVQVVQAANAIRLVLLVFIPLLLEYIRNL
jgi:hypothetical protein